MFSHAALLQAMEMPEDLCGLVTKDSLNAGGRMMVFSQHMLEAMADTLDLCDVLKRFHRTDMRGRTKATDPRDLIFGMSGLCGRPQAIGMQIDYTLSFQEVFIEAARTMIAQGNDLSHLAMCDGISADHIIRDEQLDLPSWVPDWASQQASVFWNRSDWGNWVAPEAPLSLTDQQPLAHNASDDRRGNHLIVRGKLGHSVKRKLSSSVYYAIRACFELVLLGISHCRDAVDHLKTITSELCLTERRLLLIYLQWGAAQFHSTSWLTHKDMVVYQANAYYQIAQHGFQMSQQLQSVLETSGHWVDSLDEADMVSMADAIWLFWGAAERNQMSTCEHDGPVFGPAIWGAAPCVGDCSWDPLRAWHLAVQCLAAVHCHDLFLLADGRLIISHANTQPGDQIGILHGCEYPVLLRRNKYEENHYWYVGGCFIEGSLDDEGGILPLDDPDVEPVDIVLI